MTSSPLFFFFAELRFPLKRSGVDMTSGQPKGVTGESSMNWMSNPAAAREDVAVIAAQTRLTPPRLSATRVTVLEMVEPTNTELSTTQEQREEKIDAKDSKDGAGEPLPQRRRPVGRRRVPAVSSAATSTSSFSARIGRGSSAVSFLSSAGSVLRRAGSAVFNPNEGALGVSRPVAVLVISLMALYCIATFLLHVPAVLGYMVDEWRPTDYLGITTAHIVFVGLAIAVLLCRCVLLLAALTCRWERTKRRTISNRRARSTYRLIRMTQWWHDFAGVSGPYFFYTEFAREVIEFVVEAIVVVDYANAGMNARILAVFIALMFISSGIAPAMFAMRPNGRRTRFLLAVDALIDTFFATLPVLALLGTWGWLFAGGEEGKRLVCADHYQQLDESRVWGQKCRDRMAYVLHSQANQVLFGGSFAETLTKMASRLLPLWFGSRRFFDAVISTVMLQYDLKHRKLRPGKETRIKSFPLKGRKMLKLAAAATTTTTTTGTINTRDKRLAKLAKWQSSTAVSEGASSAYSSSSSAADNYSQEEAKGGGAATSQTESSPPSGGMRVATKPTVRSLVKHVSFFSQAPHPTVQRKRVPLAIALLLIVPCMSFCIFFWARLATISCPKDDAWYDQCIMQSFPIFQLDLPRCACSTFVGVPTNDFCNSTEFPARFARDFVLVRGLPATNRFLSTVIFPGCDVGNSSVATSLLGLVATTCLSLNALQWTNQDPRTGPLERNRFEHQANVTSGGGAPRTQLDASAVSFEDVKTLRILQLSGYGLQVVPRFADSGRHVLELNLMGNRLTALPATLELKRVRGLDIAGNGFREIPRAIFACHDLRQLVLDDNAIAHVPDTINDLSLDQLSLSYNRLTALPAAGLGRHLRALRLSFNDLRAGQLGFLEQPPGSSGVVDASRSTFPVTDLWLDFNPRLGYLPPGLGRLTSLSRLQVNGCGLTELGPATILTHLRNELRVLSAAQNNISHFPVEALSKMTKLEAVNLAQNQLAALASPNDDSAIRFLATLMAGGVQWLNLAANNISLAEMPGISSFSPSPSLPLVVPMLAGNPACDGKHGVVDEAISINCTETCAPSCPDVASDGPLDFIGVLGDDTCQAVCNTSSCGFDGGTCLSLYARAIPEQLIDIRLA